jgi:hypothetical protein
MDNEELFALWSVAVKAVRYSQLSVWNFCTLPVFVLIFELQFCVEFCVISMYDLFLSSYLSTQTSAVKERGRVDIEWSFRNNLIHWSK